MAWEGASAGFHMGLGPTARFPQQDINVGCTFGAVTKFLYWAKLIAKWGQNFETRGVIDPELRLLVASNLTLFQCLVDFVLILSVPP